MTLERVSNTTVTPRWEAEGKTLFRMRSYQQPSRKARKAGCKRFVRLWHRRAGKDRDALSFILEEMLKRPGTYNDVFPNLKQGRRDVWNNTYREVINGVERSITIRDIFPQELVETYLDDDMFIRLRKEYGGATFQIVGADTDEAVESIRGGNQYGVNFSEYAHGNKMKKAWETLRPVFQENGGWAMWSYTPNGPNHGQELWDTAIANQDEYFTQKLTVDDTRRDAVGEDGSRVVSDESIAQERKEGVREEFIQQEYYCSFTGFLHGSIYGDIMMAKRLMQHIGTIPYIANFPVGIAMDLGKSDAMAAWFYQCINQSIRFIDYWEDTRKTIRDAAQVFRAKPYLVGKILLPWEGQSAADYLEEIGFSNVIVVPRTKSVGASIDHCRLTLARSYFDSGACSRKQPTGNSGLDALDNYKYKWDETLRVFTKVPVHDQWSHGADAFRAGDEGGFEPLEFANTWSQPIKVETEFDPREVAR